MLDRRGIGEVQKSQEEFGLEPFRNPVSFWQSWPRTWGWGGVWGRTTKAPRPWPCSVSAKQLWALLPRASPAQSALFPKSC